MDAFATVQMVRIIIMNGRVGVRNRGERRGRMGDCRVGGLFYLVEFGFRVAVGEM